MTHMRYAGNIDVRVGKIEHETEMIKRFHLYPVDQKPLPAFTGGSHIMTYMNSESGVIDRTYSLVSNPLDRTEYMISIRKDENSRGGSAHWHNNVKEGDQLEVSFPRNYFPLSFQAKHHVFYAAGIGITPFLTMMADLKEQGQTFELHYAARTQDLCAFYDFLNEEYPNESNFYFSRGNQPSRMTTETMLNHRIGSHVYFCGPVSMVTEYREAAKSYGYPQKAIHFELFAAADNGPKNTFTVELAESNITLEVSAEETLLDSLLQAGVDAPYSCKVGGCGSCEIEVVDGEVDHRDLFYSVEEHKERKCILTCQSRAKNKKLILNI